MKTSLGFRKALVAIFSIFFTTLLTCYLYGKTIDIYGAIMFSLFILIAVKSTMGIRWSWEKIDEPRKSQGTCTKMEKNLSPE